MDNARDTEKKRIAANGRWIMLIHQIPPKPNYLRVKIGRRLGRMGAVALKNTVYVLPRNEATLEDFQWVLREVVSNGGEATLVNAQFIDGLSDSQVEGMFRSARDADYTAVLEDARLIEQSLGEALAADQVRQVEADVARLERRMEEIASIDFFDAQARRKATTKITGLRAKLKRASSENEPETAEAESYHGRIWVTRMGIHVDRIASAWLIRRFIDPDATFKFVRAKGYKPASDELRFDMYEAEFSHEGDRCTFEVLCHRFRLCPKGLNAIAQIIHDIDLKDAKFGRPETDGVAAQITGLTLAHREDDARLARGCELFDELFAYFSRTSP